MGTDAAAFSSQSSPAPWNSRWVASSPSVSVHPMFDAVDADPVPAVRERGVAGQPDEPGLGATYGAR